MQVGDLLPGTRTCIGDEAVAAGLYAELGGDFIGGDEEVAHEGGVCLRDALQALQVLLGNDEDVNLGLGGDIRKGVDEVVFINFGGGDFLTQDFAKDGGIGGEGVAHGWSEPLQLIVLLDLMRVL